MSAKEIISELPRLSRNERVEVFRKLIEIQGDELALLAECDRRADANFQILDAMEAADARV